MLGAAYPTLPWMSLLEPGVGGAAGRGILPGSTFACSGRRA